MLQDPSLEVVLHNDVHARQALSDLSLLFSIIFMYFPSEAITALALLPSSFKAQKLSNTKNN